MTSERRSISFSTEGNNPTMDINDTQLAELEEALKRLEDLDPADLPEPAAELADLLSRILDEMESS